MVIYGRLGRLEVGDGYPVRVVGVLNVSPESFYKGSIAVKDVEVKEAVLKMVSEGCDVIDIGGRSTAPYLQTEIPVEEEVSRVVKAVKIVKDLVDIPLSVDTFRAKVAEAALKAGVDIVNDVTGLKGDEEMIKVVKDYQPSLIICAKELRPRPHLEPIERVISALKESLDMLVRADYDLSKVVVDPCIGFFRYREIPWYVWDLRVIADLDYLRILNRPIAIGVSRKSFIGVLTGREKPEERLYGSLAITSIALLRSVHVIRTHDVAVTKDVIKVVEGYKKYIMK
ncbi:MAG: dihydropteroate synthase [Desulfurococcaceae archaeon]|nr:dihydropteroate synthase [Desulfurococcaceae archaeon]